ncbi:hypothetical protein A3C67_01315 [Candidatus Nomurabacteria bacterium RIFCSPHIGHO2_02_FULL_42_19]|uniref:Uncharacterized protein n=1 Tax=Candidatus Nomurabacteria bacterium RIFCSPHIGHO2_02_FULL_42_19 TaxID=1801756 RepID=A0A1F6W285_9BACT|nr:MAG: hypothetical protein A3C67_01315 [Candidatus Nomurabacteria bacterium RIFCSPHIGHO2_02_FULL_42_19]
MEPEQKTNGALIGSVIIIIILIVGGIFLWKTSLKERPVPTDEGSTSEDDTASMEAELNAMDLENLDGGI